MITYFFGVNQTLEELSNVKSLTPVSGFMTSYSISTLPEVGTDCNAMTSDEKNSLVTAGYTKSVCPFGILIVGTSLYDDSYMQYAANVVANLMDPDHNGDVNTGNTDGNADLI